MQMANDRPFDLAHFPSHGLFEQQKRQRGRVVTKKQDALAGLQGIKSAPQLLEMQRPQLPPFRPFREQRVFFVHRQCDQARHQPQQEIVANRYLPKRWQRKLLLRPLETGHAHAADVRSERFFPQLMVADNGVKVGGEFPAQLVQAFPGALAGRVIADTDEGGIARIIAIGHDVIAPPGAGQKLVEQIIMGKRVALPKIMSIQPDGQAPGRIGDRA